MAAAIEWLCGDESAPLSGVRSPPMAAPSARASILIDNIGMLASPAGDGAPLRGPELGAVEVTT